MKKRLVAGLAACVLVLAACGDDDGGSVRNVDGEDCPSGVGECVGIDFGVGIGE